MSFTDAEKRKWHADRKAEIAETDSPVDCASCCAHCGAIVQDAGGSEDFPLCAACD